jgi:hypothetical protein
MGKASSALGLDLVLLIQCVGSIMSYYRMTQPFPGMFLVLYVGQINLPTSWSTLSSLVTSMNILRDMRVSRFISLDRMIDCCNC